MSVVCVVVGGIAGACDCEGNVDLGCGCGEAGPIEYCQDTDGDGLGAGYGIISCDDPPEAWVPNCDDDCDDIIGFDCLDECGGSAIEDECGVCNGDGPTGCDNECGSTLEFDECGVCGGDGIADGTCDCDGNVDLGCGCGEDGPSGCDEECGSTLEFDECGICGGDGALELCWNNEYVCELSDCDMLPENYPLWDSDNDGVLDNNNFYEFNGSITARVYDEDGLNLGDTSDLVAAFVGDEIRGVARASEFITGEYGFLMLVYSNQVSDEVLTFKFYDSSIDEIFDLSETIIWESNMIIGDQLNPFDFNLTSDQVLGCTDSNACNYNSQANYDNGSCDYGTIYYLDTDGDGLGSTSGQLFCDYPGDNWVLNDDDLYPNCESNIVDACGNCDGDSSECSGCLDPDAANFCEDCVVDDNSCVYTPTEFVFNQSTQQAFYFIVDANIDGESLVEGEDWIAAFNDEICVGSRQWNGTFTDIPAMGDDGTFYSSGYLNQGDIPTFRIYDASENTYYTTESSEVSGWSPLQYFNVDFISVLPDCFGTLSGTAYLDSCGVCSGGETGHIADSDIDAWEIVLVV